MVLPLVHLWWWWCCLFLCQCTRVKCLVAVVAVVDDEDGVQCQRWGGRSMAAALFDGGHITICGAQWEDKRAARQEDERAAQQEATQQPAGTRRREGGAVRGRWEDETMASVTRGNATTRRRDEMTRGRRSERTTRERGCDVTRRQDGGVTRCDATTSLHD
jgi:hypothetical protein